ncbi:MAG: hypothetical protein JXX29_23460 [Deltaproteobacteria bacterium]|nr:hypothetical protein [Deltaproteobacteria bacterium]MBN2674659.1 hypothetical protein [Deltaproteobacteria bacterium]
MRFRLILGVLVGLLCTQAWSEDLSYVDDEELSVELDSRTQDLERTRARISDVERQLLAQQNEIFNLKQQLERVEQKLVQRTSMLYRLSKNGKSVQYLFSSNSATAFVKRMQTLRKLVTSEMDEKRELSVQLARATDEVNTLKDERSSAQTLATQLEAVVANLQQELQRRQTAPLNASF